MKAVVALLSICLLLTVSCTNTTMEDNLKNADTTIQQLSSQVDNSNTQMKSLVDQLSTATTSVQSLQQQVSTGNATNKSLQTALNSAQGQVNTLNGTIRLMQQQLDSNNATIKSLQTQLSVLNTTLLKQLSDLNTAMQTQLNAANATIQTLQTQLLNANTSVNALQQQLADAAVREASLNNTIAWLSKIAPTPGTATVVGYDVLYKEAQNNEVAFNLDWTNLLVQMSQLKVVKVYDTPVKADLISPGGKSFTLIFQDRTGMEKLLSGMTITVFGTCDGCGGGTPKFFPDFALVQIDSVQ